MHVCKNRLQKISYCGEDKTLGDKVFAYIVKAKVAELYHCFCFETQSPVSRGETVQKKKGKTLLILLYAVCKFDFFFLQKKEGFTMLL